MDNQRQIHDPIHGLISLDKRLFKIIDTPIFQRLRSLKQLGGAYFVFPGASHNRFEHSIGTCYLAGKWMRELKKRSPEGKIITDEDIFHIEIAALCHDLGHGPFSHTFEDVFLANNTELKKKLEIKFHEHASGVLLRNIIANIPESLGLSPSDIDNICAIILGKVPASWPKNKLFMFEVVSNPYNSIDVDKFDYLARDCYAANLGLDASNVFTRLMQFSEIRKTDEEERHICFGEKEEFNIHLVVYAYLGHWLYERDDDGELLIGDLSPIAVDLSHRCHHRSCFNPFHFFFELGLINRLRCRRHYQKCICGQDPTCLFGQQVVSHTRVKRAVLNDGTGRALVRKDRHVGH